MPTPLPTAAPTATPDAHAEPDAGRPTVTPLNAVRALPLGHARADDRHRRRGGRASRHARADRDRRRDAGLVVRGLPGAATLARGTRLEVTGKLAAPYGQLEIRPAEADVHVLGTGALPTPTSLTAAGLVEADEGHLVTATGRLDAKPKKSAAGDLTLILKRDGACAGQGHGRRHRAGSTLAAFKVGATYRIVGFVGQRATRSGALDGYRIWIRDAADLMVVAAAVAIGAVRLPEAPGRAGADRRP